MTARNTILIDAGSSFTKALKVSPDGGETRRVSFASIVAPLGINPPDIPAQKDPESGEGFVFRWAGKYWAVGDVAASMPESKPIKGGRRYTSELWRALVAGAICALADETEQVNLMVAVPLRGGEAAENAIRHDLQDNYVVKLYDPHHEGGNLGQRTIRIGRIDTMHETEGSYFYHLLTPYGEPRPDAQYRALHKDCTSVQALYESGLLMVDGGGWTVDMLPVGGLHPDFNRAVTLRGDYGLQWVMIWLQDALQSHPVVGGGADRPQRILADALIPEYTRGGKPKFTIQYGRKRVDVAECVEAAVMRLDNAIAEHVMTALDGGRDHAFMILTGGAAEAAYPWMQTALTVMADTLGIDNHVMVLQPDMETPPFMHNVEGMRRYLVRKWARMAAG